MIVLFVVIVIPAYECVINHAHVCEGVLPRGHLLSPGGFCGILLSVVISFFKVMQCSAKLNMLCEVQTLCMQEKYLCVF